MRILDQKQNDVTIIIESTGDIWALSTIIEKGDCIKGTTLRKVTIGNKESEKTKVSKKPMYLEIIAEKVEFKTDSTKVLGTITKGPDDIPLGEHHSFSLSVNDTITISKNWQAYQLQYLKEVAEKKDVSILACLFDRETALLGKLEQNDFSIIANIKGTVEKKQFEQKDVPFFKEVVTEINKKIQAYNPEVILFGSSSFWRHKMIKEVEQDIQIPYIFATISDVSKAGFNELLKQQEVKQSLSKIDALKHTELVDYVFESLAKNKPVAYGISDCLSAAEAGAIESVLCTQDLIVETKEKGEFEQIAKIFSLVEKAKGTIHILSGKNESIQKLNGILGIAAILRFQIE